VTPAAGASRHHACDRHLLPPPPPRRRRTIAPEHSPRTTHPPDADHARTHIYRAQNFTPKPGQQARREIDVACSKGDFAAAFAAFDAAVDAGDPLQPHSFNVLLHLCSGGTTGGNYGKDDAASNNDVAAPQAKVVVPSADAVHAERANAIFNKMVTLDIPRTEMTYTALARIEAATGEPRKALDIAKRLIDERLTPKLRTFAPALHAFCIKGDIAGALETEAEITKAGIEISELEYAVLLTAYADASKWEDGLALLRRMREEIRSLAPPLMESVRGFFQSHPQWGVEESVNVDEATGAASSSPSNSKMQLAAIDLSPEDRASLLAGIGKLAREREAKSSFDGFVGWLNRRGPLPYLVDGANVGMYNQNFQTSGFNFNQVEKVMNALRPLARDTHGARRAACGGGDAEPTPEAAVKPKEGGNGESKAEAEGNTEENTEEQTEEMTEEQRNLDAGLTPIGDIDITNLTKNPGVNTPVNFLHVRRVRGGPANHHRSKQLIDGWKRCGELFVCPQGSNDDWYWLYAAVASGNDTFLVSNDEMRDHAFQMLPAPRLFAKWKERHQVRFHMSAANGLEFYHPPPYTSCVQEGKGGDWWLFPGDDGEWTCAVKK